MTPTEAKLRAALIRLLWRSIFDDAECTCAPDDPCCECDATEALGLGRWHGAEWAESALPAIPHDAEPVAPRGCAEDAN